MNESAVTHPPGSGHKKTQARIGVLDAQICMYVFKSLGRIRAGDSGLVVSLAASTSKRQQAKRSWC